MSIKLGIKYHSSIDILEIPDHYGNMEEGTIGIETGIIEFIIEKTKPGSEVNNRPLALWLGFDAMQDLIKQLTPKNFRALQKEKSLTYNGCLILQGVTLGAREFRLCRGWPSKHNWQVWRFQQEIYADGENENADLNIEDFRLI